MLNASLTWSRSEGLNMIAHGDYWDPSLIWYAGDFGKDPNDLTNAKGLLQNDRTWVLKVQAGYTFPWDILASLNYYYQTGIPLPIYIRLDGLNQDPHGLGRRILAESRNDDNRTDGWSRLDVRLQKTFNLHKSLRFKAILDVFNVFNTSTIVHHASYDTWAENYLEPDWIFFPRRFQIGARLEF